LVYIEELVSTHAQKQGERTMLIRGNTSISEKNNAKSMQDFMQKIRRHRERWGGQKARQNRNT